MASTVSIVGFFAKFEWLRGIVAIGLLVGTCRGPSPLSHRCYHFGTKAKREKTVDRRSQSTVIHSVFEFGRTGQGLGAKDDPWFAKSITTTIHISGSALASKLSEHDVTAVQFRRYPPRRLVSDVGFVVTDSVDWC